MKNPTDFRMQDKVGEGESAHHMGGDGDAGESIRLSRGPLALWLSFQNRQPYLFGALLILFIGYGAYIAAQGEIEAFPEFTNVQVQVITQDAGKASEEVERQVTIPLEVAVNGVPGLINQRSISIFGLSVITLTFDDSISSRQARLDISQKLTDADLPEGVKPSLSPDSTPVGEIFRYTIKGDVPVDELRMIENWQLEREFKSIPGVADVVSFGGPAREIDVKLDLEKMRALGLTASTIAQALGQNHANAGGAMISRGEEGYVVRSIGMFEKPENLEAAVIATQNHIPVHVRDIGSVQIGHKPRLGVVGINEREDVVEGIILLRQGADSLKTCAQIRAKIDFLNQGVLPRGVSISPYYDRTDLIVRSSHTVFHNIIFGISLVCVVLLFGLGFRFWPMTLAVALIIPFSLLMVFIGLKLLGLTPNLISLGAVDFGIIIETAIFSAEAVITALMISKSKSGARKAFSSVLGPALLCALLLVIAFIPILSLQRVEGRIFRPLGITLVAALIGGQLGTLIFIPIAMRFCKAAPGFTNRVDKWVHHRLETFVALIVGLSKKISRISVLNWKMGAGLAIAVGIVCFGLGREFLPQLNEGSLYIRATAPSTISIEASTELANRIRTRLKTIPEVRDVVSQMGRPDDGTDVNGFDNIETFVSLVPAEEWRSAKTLDGLEALAQNKLKDIEGVDFNYSQPIKDNVDEAISGVKGELVVKIYGANLVQLQKLGDQVETILKSIPGAEDVGAEQLLGQPELRFEMNRDLLARYGLRVTDAEDVLETALMGKVAARMTDEQGRTTDIVVKPELPESPRRDLLASLPVVTADGARVPLGEVAAPHLSEGVGRIYRDGGERRIAVKCSVRNRAVVDFVHEASSLIGKQIKLPPKYRLTWSGSFENAERASHQLAMIVPLCVVAMLILLHAWFKSWRLVSFLIWEIPFAALGGITALRLFQLNFSISAAAGGIVLVGVTFLTGMMLISEWRASGDIWIALQEKGRSILLSNLVAIIGLVPAAFSQGIGSETAKPFAVMILGGLMSSLILSLLVLPALIYQYQVGKRR